MYNINPELFKNIVQPRKYLDIILVAIDIKCISTRDKIEVKLSYKRDLIS